MLWWLLCIVSMCVGWRPWPREALARPAFVERFVAIFAHVGLGVVMYELLTLQRPFEAPNLQSLALKTTRNGPAPWPATAPTFARKYALPICWMLTKDPEKRPTAEKVLEKVLNSVLTKTLNPPLDAWSHLLDGSSESCTLESSLDLTLFNFCFLILKKKFL